jgi:diketogulonate reductase-like aldo/keto reductase
LIAWALRRGVAVLPKSATPERAKENASLERASDVVDRMDAAAGAVGGGGEARDALEAMDAMGDGDGAEKYCWDPSVVR